MKDFHKFVADICCRECDDHLYGTVEEEFDVSGAEEYEDWGVDEAWGYAKYQQNYKKITGKTPEEKVKELDDFQKKLAQQKAEFEARHKKPVSEATYQGKEVQLNKPFRTSDGKGKFAVYTMNDKGNVVKVNFGDTSGLTIKTDDPDRRRNFRARHNCDDPGPKWKARYWSCKAWSRGSVDKGLGL